MTVADLMSALDKLPSKNRVLVQGNEGGFFEIGHIQQVKVRLNYEKEDWNGPHE